MVDSGAAQKEKKRHEILVQELENYYRPFLAASSDGIFIYLDDEHKTCNQNLADIFGYSIEEWAKIYPFLDKFIAEESRSQVMHTYRRSRERNMSSHFEFVGLRKDGSTFRAQMAMLPISVAEDFFTLNLVRKL